MYRRHFLRAVAASGALALAGCSEGGASGTPAELGGGSGSNPFGSGGGGSGADDGSGSDGGSGAGGSGGSGAGGGSGSGPGSGSGSDGDGSTATATPEPTPTQTVEWTATPTATSPTLGDLSVEFADNYRFAMDFSNYQGASVDVAISGEWHAPNFHTRSVYEDDVVDVWVVDGNRYFATGGHCTALSGSGGINLPDVDAEDWADTEESKRRLEDWADVTASGDATIDGEGMWRFQVTAGERGNEWGYIYFLSKETGYLRRVETQGIVIEYWDWGNVGPIGAPC